MGIISGAVINAGGEATGIVPWAMVKAGGEKDKGVGVEKVYVVLDEEGREKVCVTWEFLEYPLS